MAFNFILNFWRTTAENGSMTWAVSENAISIFYYFNDENIDLQKILELLNSFAVAYCLNQHGWNLPFVLQTSDSETWNDNYFKRVEFIVKRS